jgi:hypothetical protein
MAIEIQIFLSSEPGLPFIDAFIGEKAKHFVILNMAPEGIWYVDKRHQQYDVIHETALLVARTHGDSKTVDELLSPENLPS